MAQLTVVAFVLKHPPGQHIDCGPDCAPDGYRQCAALCNRWCCDNGYPTPRGAFAAALAFPPPWQEVPLAQARSGDLVVFSADLPGSDGDGHICLFDHFLTGGGFQSYDQNPEGLDAAGEPGPCRYYDHVNDVAYVQAVWRYPQPTPAPIPPQEEEDMLLIAAPAGQGIWLLSGSLFVPVSKPETQTALLNAGVKKAAVDPDTFAALKAAANK